MAGGGGIIVKVGELSPGAKRELPLARALRRIIELRGMVTPEKVDEIIATELAALPPDAIISKGERDGFIRGLRAAYTTLGAA